MSKNTNHAETIRLHRERYNATEGLHARDNAERHERESKYAGLDASGNLVGFGANEAEVEAFLSKLFPGGKVVETASLA